PRHRHAVGKRHADAAILADHLLRYRNAARAGRDVIGRRSAEQAAAGGLPDRHDNTVADPDPRLWRPAIFLEARMKILAPAGEQRGHDIVVDVDEIEADLAVLDFLILQIA